MKINNSGIIKPFSVKTKSMVLRWMFSTLLIGAAKVQAQDCSSTLMSPQTVSFLRMAVSEMKVNGYLVSKFHPSEFERIQRHFWQDTLISSIPLRRNNEKDTLIFSLQDRQLVNDYLKTMKAFKWERDAINLRQLGFKGLISLDTLQTNDCGHPNYYSFLPPLFLRNESVCIFYFQESCGCLCGGGSLFVYRKENEQWVRWMNIWSWIS